MVMPQLFLCKRILCGIRQALRSVVLDVADSEELEDLEESFSVMAERHGAVVRISLLDENVSVEAAHLRDGEHADTAETSGGHRQDFAFCDVGAENTFAVALQTEEGDVAGGDVAFQSSSGEVRLGSFRLKVCAE